jgi:hypothetical protein
MYDDSYGWAVMYDDGHGWAVVDDDRMDGQ